MDDLFPEPPDCIRYYDRDGERITFNMWTRLWPCVDYRGVAYHEEPDGTRVSTVWLGLDHALLGLGPPLIFETMVFGGPLNQEQERYSTEEAARAGHERWVAAVKARARYGAGAQ